MTEEQIVILVGAGLLILAMLFGLIQYSELNRTLNTLRSEYIKIKRDCDLLSSRVENHIERKIIYCQRVCPFDKIGKTSDAEDLFYVPIARLYAEGRVKFGICRCGEILEFPARECPKCHTKIKWEGDKHGITNNTR